MYYIVNNMLLFSLAHPWWEFVFQPKYTAYLNRIDRGGRCCGPWP
jgi:hypothetical protein